MIALRPGMSSIERDQPTSDELSPCCPCDGKDGDRRPGFAGRRESTLETGYPTWLVMLLSFIVGVAVTAGALAPTVITPEYQRGHADGYAEGYDRLSQKLSEASRAAAQLRHELELRR